MSRKSREERSGRSRSSGPKKAGAVASAVLFLASLAAGFGAAALVRRVQGDGTAGPSLHPSGAAPGSAAAVPPERLAQAESLFQKGVEELTAERYSDAFEDLTRAAELDPTDPRPHHGLGKIYDQLFLREKSEEEYRKAIEADPGYRPSKESLAMLLYEKGKHDEAISILEGLQKETPDDPFVWAELAINATAVGRHQDAILLLERYNAAKGKQAWGHTHLGRAYAGSGLVDRAEAAYREAIAIDPRFSLAYHWLGQLLVAARRQEESEPFLETYRHLQQLSVEEHEAKMALLGNPGDVKALVSLARVHFLMGRPKESLAALDRALKLSPGDPKILELREKVARPAGKGE